MPQVHSKVRLVQVQLVQQPVLLQEAQQERPPVQALQLQGLEQPAPRLPELQQLATLRLTNLLQHRRFAEPQSLCLDFARSWQNVLLPQWFRPLN